MCAAPAARAHTAPEGFLRPRPPFEVTSWVALGGGALMGAEARGVFDLRLGGDLTGAVGRRGDLRVGPFVEAGSASFASLSAVGGVELFLGAAPRPLRMFLYAGEGTLAVRLGAGYVWRRDLLGAPSSPVASLTVAYGYRAPFSLREPETEWVYQPEAPRPARYMVGVRLWVNATVDLAGAPATQVTAGLEFEPVGSARYLFGLY